MIGTSLGHYRIEEKIGAGAISISPDGEWVAVNPPDSGVVLYPITGEKKTRPVPGLTPDDIPITWSADDRSFFVNRRGGLPARVYRVDVETGRMELWEELMPSDPVGVGSISTVVMSPDGLSYAYTYVQGLSKLYLVEGLK